MSEGKRFTCPTCGSSLNPEGAAAQIKCPYCGNSVIVPEELRAAAPPVFIQTAFPASESAGSTSRLGCIIAALIPLIILGILAAVFFAALPGSATPTPVAKATATPAGFAHVALRFGGEGTAPGLFQEARYLAVEPAGTIYVGEYKTRRVQRFDATGKYVSGWTVDADLCSNKSANFNNIAADRAGNVYVSFCGLIVKYDGATGKLLDTFNRVRNSFGDFYMGVDTIPGGDLLVWASGSSSQANEVILRLDANGKILARLPNLVTNQAERQANAMTIQAAMDGLGNLFILNKDDYYIYKYTREGKYVSKFGGEGSRPGQFRAWAHDMALDNQSRVYVIDFDGLQVFDSNGVFLEKMKDPVTGGISELKIDEKNGIYSIAGKSTILKLEWNGQ